MKRIIALSAFAALLVSHFGAFSQNKSRGDIQNKLDKQQYNISPHYKKISEESEEHNIALHQQADKLQRESEFLKRRAINYQERVLQIHKESSGVVAEALFKDRLIKKDEDYQLELNAEEMVLNGTVQPESVHAKYRKLIDEEWKKTLIKAEKEENKMHEYE